MTASKASIAHAMEDRVAQDAGVVDHAIELAEAVDRGLTILLARELPRRGFEFAPQCAALLDLIDHLFRRCRTRPEPSLRRRDR